MALFGKKGNSPYSQEAMQARFHELGKAKAEIDARLNPLREQRDKLAQEYEPKMRKLNAEIKKIMTEELFDLDMERGALAKALKRQTGLPS